MKMFISMGIIAIVALMLVGAFGTVSGFSGTVSARHQMLAEVGK